MPVLCVRCVHRQFCSQILHNQDKRVGERGRVSLWYSRRPLYLPAGAVVLFRTRAVCYDVANSFETLGLPMPSRMTVRTLALVARQTTPRILGFSEQLTHSRPRFDNARPLVHWPVARDTLQQRRLPRAVLPHQSHAIPGHDRQIHIRHEFCAAERGDKKRHKQTETRLRRLAWD